MSEKENILGCFISAGSVNSTDSEEIKKKAKEQGELFKLYIFGENGLHENIKSLKAKKYGKDMETILFQFYVNPIPYLLQNLKEIESYRKQERAIGIPVIVNDQNFFSKSESERYDFLRESMLQKLHILSEVIKKKKLDTNIELLISDLKLVLINYI